MKYRNPKLLQLLAAEYVLGTLRGAARRRFERLLPGHPALQHELRFWEQRLAGLQGRFTPQTPREVVWAEIDRRLHADRVATLPAARRQRPPRDWTGLWRGWALAASVLASVLGLLLWQELQQSPQIIEKIRTVVRIEKQTVYVALLQPNAPASWMVMLSPGKPMLKVASAGEFPLDLDRQDLQLWVLDDAGTPHPMGMIPKGGTTAEMPLPQMPLPARPVMAVSLEPKGGSPTGLPTGPVVTTAPLLQL